MKETISLGEPTTEQEVADAIAAVVLLGMPPGNAKVLVEEIRAQGQAAAIEIQELIETLNELGHTACAQRDAQRELAETWSAISCTNSIEIAQLRQENRRLRALLKEGLDWLSGFEHQAALSIRIKAEALGGAD